MQEGDAPNPRSDRDDPIGFNPFGSGPVPIRPRIDRHGSSARCTDEGAKGA